MSLKKRALALLPGLFLFISIAHTVFAEEALPSGGGAAVLSLSTGAGTLLVTDDGASGYGSGGLELELFPNGGADKKIYLGFELGRLSSNLPWLEGSVAGFAGKFRAETPALGIRLRSGVFDQSRFSVEGVKAGEERASFFNEGGRGFFLNLETPSRIGPLIIAPSFLYGEGSWEEGDLYWFLGKPDIPELCVLGLSLRLDPADKYTSYEGALRHELGVRFFRADLDIVSNEERLLFTSNPEAAFASYTVQADAGGFDFSGSLGWLFFRASLAGELTSANQHYFLFPYLSYKVDGSFSAHSGFAGFGLAFRAGIFRYALRLGALRVFGGRGSAAADYLEKPLYGGGTGSEKFSPRLQGAGIAWLFLEAGIPELLFGANKNKRFSLGIQKTFVLPWGYQNIFPEEDGGDTASVFSGGGALSIAKTALLSGLSLHASFSW